MARNVPGRPGGAGPGVYWRRRVTVLAAGLGFIAVAAWALTGIGGTGASSRTRRGTGRPVAAASATGSAPVTASSAAGRDGSGGRGGAAGGSGGGGAARGGPGGGTGAAGGSGGRGGAAGGSGGRGAPRARSGSGGGAARLPAGLPPACAPRDVVLSLAASQGSYGPGRQPRFEVYVVSLSARPCSVDVAPADLSVVIRAGGRRRVWASADCAASAAQFAQLSRGVPEVLHFSWDRRGSAPGCRGSRSAARPGTYTATAVAPRSHLASQDTVFVLSAPGAGMP